MVTMTTLIYGGNTVALLILALEVGTMKKALIDLADNNDEVDLELQKPALYHVFPIK